MLDLDQLEKDTKGSLARNKMILLLLFAFFSLLMVGFLLSGPPLSASEQAVLFRIPNSSTDFMELIDVMKRYAATSYSYTLAVFCFAFLFLQSFGIPGPIILSIISGALFGRWTGLFLVTLCSTVGSSVCYFLSNTRGRGLVVRAFPRYVAIINHKLQSQRDKLLYYLLFLRLAPVVPNWLINLSAPILGIDKRAFVTATFFGLIPANILLIQSGLTLSDMHEVGLSYEAVGVLFVLGLLALVPTMLAKQRQVAE